MKQEDKSKALNYGGNILFNPLASAVNDSIGSKISMDLAHPNMALGFVGLDVLDRIFPQVRNSKFSRLAKVAGAAYYGGKSIAKMISIANGDYNSIFSLPFDVMMSIQLTSDSIDSYDYSNRNLLNDVNVFRGMGSSLAEKLRNFANKRTVPSP